MLKKVSRKKKSEVDERRAFIINPLPPVSYECFFGCAIRCDGDLDVEDSAWPSGNVVDRT